jgi:Putative restriction endonuclease
VNTPAELHAGLAELAWEQEQDPRHEYVQGEVRLMTGGSARHEALVRRIDRVLGDVHDEALGAMPGVLAQSKARDGRVPASELGRVPNPHATTHRE